MKTITVYIADDNTKFLDENICLEYEKEKSKNPDDPGIIFYNSSGQEIDLNYISSAAYCKVTNSIIANALYNSIRMMNIKQNCKLPMDDGYYVLLGNGKDPLELSKAMFNEIISTVKNK